MSLFKNKYRIASARWQQWDYTNPGAYFITICTKNRICYFGKCEKQKMYLNEIGKMAEKFWFAIPQHFHNISLDEFVIMPNHIHGIIIIQSINCDNTIVETLHCNVSTSIMHIAKNKQMSRISPKSGSLSTIIRSFKSVCTREINSKYSVDFKWQERFRDRVIRNKKEFQRIKQYIINNPKNWNVDKLFNE